MWRSDEREPGTRSIKAITIKAITMGFFSMGSFLKGRAIYPCPAERSVNNPMSDDQRGTHFLARLFQLGPAPRGAVRTARIDSAGNMIHRFSSCCILLLLTALAPAVASGAEADIAARLQHPNVCDLVGVAADSE